MNLPAPIYKEFNQATAKLYLKVLAVLLMYFLIAY